MLSDSPLVLDHFLVAHSETVWNVKHHPKEDMIATASSDRNIKLFVREGTEYQEKCCVREEHTKSIRCLSWSHCGNYLASGGFDALVVIWTLQRREGSLGLVSVTTLEGHESEVKSVDWHPSGDFLASSSRDQSIFVWERLEDSEDLEMDCVSVMTGHSQDVKFVCWANESTLLFSASYDNTIKVWTRDLDEDDWVLVTTIAAHEDTVWCLAVHAFHLASVSQSGEVALWDLHPLASLLNGQTYDMASVVDLKRLDLNSESHTRPVYCCAFSP